MDRDDRGLTVRGRLEAGRHAAAGTKRARRGGARFRARVPEGQSRARRGGAHDVPDADAGWRRQLEVRRDLHDAGARRAAGGVHERRRAAALPRAHADAGDRHSAGDRRGAFPADPASSDREPGPRAARRIGRDRGRLPRHPGHADVLSIPAELPVKIPVPHGRAHAPRQPRAVGPERALLRPRAGAAEHAHEPGQGPQGGRRRRARRRPQASVGPQRARGGADRHVDDAARGLLPDGPRLSAQRRAKAPGTRRITC